MLAVSLAVLTFAALGIASRDAYNIAQASPAGPIPISSWPSQGERADDRSLIRDARATWQAADPAAAHDSAPHVLLAASDATVGVVVILRARDASGADRIATFTGARRAPGTLVLRDDEPTDRVTHRGAIAVLTATPEDRIDDSRLAIVLAAPGRTVKGLSSSAFDIYRQHASTAPYVASVVPADATVANTSAVLNDGTAVPLTRASTMPAAITAGQAAIDYLPTGYHATRAVRPSPTTTTRTLSAAGHSITITEQRGAGLQTAALAAAAGNELTPASPHGADAMNAIQTQAGYGFAWTNHDRTRGYTVIADGTDAQILAYHIAQATQTP